MRYAIIAGGVVDTVYDYDPRPDVAVVEVEDQVYPGMVWDGAAWAAPPVPLDATRAAKEAALRAACTSAITGGFVSSALGAPHHYPSGDVDQRNLLGSVTASLLADAADWETPFWCRDEETGEWAFTPHSAREIQRVGVDGKTHIVACQRRLAERLQRVADADTADEIAPIAWGGE